MTSDAQIAVFDLDGTLTQRDTYLPFLFGYLWRRPARLMRVAGLTLVATRFWAGKIGNDELKERFLEAFLKGAKREQIESWTKSFVSNVLRNGLRRGALQTLRNHQRAGDIVILMTASLDLYVHHLAEELGFRQVICTAVEWKDERLTGRLASPNRRAEEKVRCLGQIRSDYPQSRIVAYGDHLSDIPYLLAADEAVFVGRGVRAAKVARSHGIEIRDWR